MQINSDSNVKYVFKTKSNPAIFTHKYIKSLNSSVTQSINATAEIRRDNNALINENLPVNIVNLQDIIPNLALPGTRSVVADLSIDIAPYTNTLIDSYTYYVVFIIAYSENGVLVETSKISYGFKVFSNAVSINIIAKDSDTITPEIINNKFAKIIAPGVLHGLKITKGTGIDMFDLYPGEAMAANGAKLDVQNINYNIIKAFPPPSTGSRVDAICITNNGLIENIPGAINAGVPVIDESDKTVIGFLYSDNTMLGTAQSRYIPRDSLSQINAKRKYRKHNYVCEAIGTNQYAIAYNIVSISEILYDGDGLRISIGAYKITPGTQTLIEFITPQLGPITADFDIAKNYYPESINDALGIIPTTQQYPWDDSQIFFRNAPINAVHANNIIYGWNNLGDLGPYNKFIISKSSPYAPDALLFNYGVKLPRNISNPVTGLITMNNASQSTHTMICVLSFENIISGMIADSDSIEDGNINGPLSNFGVSLAGFPVSPRLVFTHCGHRYEHEINMQASTKYMFSFVMDAVTTRTQVYLNNIQLFDEINTFLLNLNTLSEIYLKNELEPTIYLFGYWDRAMSFDDIGDIYSAVINNQLV